MFHTINETNESHACVGSMDESDQERRDIVAIKKHHQKNKQNFSSTLIKYSFMYILEAEIWQYNTRYA
jgi:hypothetical protein